MLTIIEILLGFLAVLLIGATYWYLSIPKNLPPGPHGWPFIGSALDYLDGSKQHLILEENVKKYGPVYKLYIANQLVIVLGTYEAIREAFVKQADTFAGRPLFHIGFVDKRFRRLGIALSEGALWKEQRRIAVSTFRKFSTDGAVIEPSIKEGVDYLVRTTSKLADTGLPFDPQLTIARTMSDIICRIVFGRCFDYDGKGASNQVELMQTRLWNAAAQAIGPLVQIHPGCQPPAKQFHFQLQARILTKHTEGFADFVESLMKATIASYDPHVKPDNYVYAFLRSVPTERNRPCFKYDQLLATCIDLSAGMDTTSTTIRWAILFLCHNPNFQETLYQEIKNKGAETDALNYSVKAELPFAEAVVMETQRLANVAPLGVPRRTTSPTCLMGHNIPADAIVVPLLSNVLHNPEFYPEPLKFDPYRFLDANGNIVRDPKLIPLQIGKRVCIGESLARMELFHVIIGLFGRFRFYFPDDKPAPSLDPVVGFTCSPVPYQVCVSARSD